VKIVTWVRNLKWGKAYYKHGDSKVISCRHFSIFLSCAKSRVARSKRQNTVIIIIIILIILMVLENEVIGNYALMSPVRTSLSPLLQAEYD
jgi:hypothetical protein